ncbi:MAG: aromatic-ring-hydroxylating dioxygenase subunit beta [Sphingomonadaceae bacterium]
MITRDEAHDLIAREGMFLDARRWDEWLSLFTEDVTYWVPAWADEVTPTSDPQRELSLIHYQGRHNLEDRVWRLKSGLSIASTPLVRTSHMTSNILVDADGRVHASFTVHCYNARLQHSHLFFGHYAYELRAEGAAWKIAKKTTTLLNDCIPAVADIYML